MTEFHDRRNNGHLPQEEDYERALTPHETARANARFRASGMPGVVSNKNRELADTLVENVTRMRREARKKEGKDFRSVGEYLEFLNSIPGEEHVSSSTVPAHP
jgi:hypothetical protein